MLMIPAMEQEMYLLNRQCIPPFEILFSTFTNYNMIPEKDYFKRWFN